MATDAAPRSVVIYGALGLIPFLAPPILVLAHPDLRPQAAQVQSLYAGLILSFLGGVRWGFAVKAPSSKPMTVTLSMVPTLAGLAILAQPGHAPRPELLSLAAALAAQWAWDLRVADAPAWFASLRTVLTIGAVAGLGLGAWVYG